MFSIYENNERGTISYVFYSDHKRLDYDTKYLEELFKRIALWFARKFSHKKGYEIFYGYNNDDFVMDRFTIKITFKK